jgi:hypothetical protein
MKYLGTKHLNNAHLTCKKLDEIASSHVPTKLLLNHTRYENFFENNLVPEQRIFEEISIRYRERFINYHLLIYGLPKLHGHHLRKLSIYNSIDNVSRADLINILSVTPNLHHLNLQNFKLLAEIGEITRSVVKLPKLRTLEMIDCHPCVNDFVEIYIQTDCLREVILGPNGLVDQLFFLISHQNTIKKLGLTLDDASNADRMLSSFAILEKLRLEHFELTVNRDLLNALDERFSDFLKRNPDMKILKLRGTTVSKEFLIMICDKFQKLEEFSIFTTQVARISANVTRPLHKLNKLRKLELGMSTLEENHLQGLAMVVNENLQELEANFDKVSRNFIQKLANFIPNLKKLVIKGKFQQNLDVLKLFPKLEHVEVTVQQYHENPSLFKRESKVLRSNLKRLIILPCSQLNKEMSMKPENVKQLVNNFRNLEVLKMFSKNLTDKSVRILLTKLKQLRILHLDNFGSDLSRKVIQFVAEYGKNLDEFFMNNISCDRKFAEKELMDFKGLRVYKEGFEIAVKFGLEFNPAVEEYEE